METNITAGPTTLIEAIRYFSDLDLCNKLMAEMKWPNGPECPSCGCKEHSYLSTRRLWKCKDCKKQYSVKVGTIMEDSPIGLDKWFTAMWMIANDKNGVSSYEVHRALGITQKSAWFLLHRIRTSMTTGSFAKFTGVCESDETYVGGKAKNMHASRRKDRIDGRGSVGKDIVHGVLQRGKEKNESKVKATVVPNAKGKTLVPIVKDTVEAGSTVYTDALQSYNALVVHYTHAAIDHAIEYVRGAVHTNGMENFWSLFKRCVHGTYVAIDAPHLQRYVDEEVFRFNERKSTDGERFAKLLPNFVGKRLTYKQLIGKDTGSEPQP